MIKQIHKELLEGKNRPEKDEYLIIEHDTEKDLYRIKISSAEKEISTSEWSERDEKDPFFIKRGTLTLRIGSRQYDKGKIAITVENVLRNYLGNIKKDVGYIPEQLKEEWEKHKASKNIEEQKEKVEIMKQFYNFLKFDNEAEIRMFRPEWDKSKSDAEKKTEKKSYFVKNVDEFISVCKKNNGKKNIYVGINERKTSGTLDKDVDFITNIGHDIDAHDGTEESLDLAGSVALKIEEDTIKQGFQQPLVLWSGYGYWVIHHISPIANNEENIKKIKEFGKKIKEKYEVEGIEVDSTVYNPSRIARVPGTLNLRNENKKVGSSILNEPTGKEDYKLSQDILGLEIKKVVPVINATGTTPTINSFMDYCLTHEIPKGERHKVISRNMAIYISDNPDREILKEQYIKIQKGIEGELDQYLKNIDENGKEAYPFSIGELVNFTKKYKIPFEWKQVPEYQDYLKLKKSEKILANEVKAEKIMKKSGEDLEDLKEDVLTLIALKKPREATEKIMEVFLKNNYIYSTRDDEKSEMWIYDDGIYVPQGKTFIKEFCGVVFGKVYTTQLANEVVEKIRVKTYINQDEFFKTTYVYEIPIFDGILNVKTRKVSPFTPDKIFFNKLPLNYVPEQKCPKIDQFFSDVLSCEGDIEVMKEIIGSLLVKDYFIEKAVMFNGNGRNGKGKTHRLMENFVGSANVCNVGISSMQKDNFDLEDLFGKLLNIGGDTGQTALKDTGCFKELTGRDGVNLKRKFKRTLRFINYAKHVLGCNDLPIVYDNTEGFWTKWVLIDFLYEFKTKEEIEELPIEERKNKKIINFNIIEEISTQDELNGLLNEALDGLDRLLKNNDFSYSKGTEYIKKTWKRRANSFLAFCEDYIEEDEDSSIVKIRLKKAYGKYCKKYNLKSKVGDKIMKNTLENDYFVEEVRDLDRNRLWKGIKFKEIPNIPTINNLIGKNLIRPIRVKPMGIMGKLQDKDKSQRELDVSDVLVEEKDEKIIDEKDRKQQFWDDPDCSKENLKKLGFIDKNEGENRLWYSKEINGKRRLFLKKGLEYFQLVPKIEVVKI